MASVFPKPVVATFPSHTGRHVIGGKPSTPGAVCPNCELPFTRFFYLDVTDPNLGDHQTNLSGLELLYCWQCPVAQSEFSYQFGEFKLLKCATGPKEDDFPYEDYPRWFPEARVDFQPMPAQLAHQIEQYQDLSENEPDRINKFFTFSERDHVSTPRHQLGGTPFRFENSVPTCPLCSRQMQFLMTVANSSTDPPEFVGNDYVQVVYHLCVTCSVVTATHECD
ncbi:MAG: hypothetical protein WCK51_12850 [Armatimonadota bacterium]